MLRRVVVAIERYLLVMDAVSGDDLCCIRLWLKLYSVLVDVVLSCNRCCVRLWWAIDQDVRDAATA